MHERLRKTLETALFVSGILYLVSQAAFSRGVRKQIGYRDGWECQCEDGCDLGRDGSPARFQDGFMVDAAHHYHDASAEWYDDPQNGRTLCLAHHYLDELAKGNMGVLGLLGSRDPYTTYVRSNKSAYPWLNGHKTVIDIIKG